MNYNEFYKNTIIIAMEGLDCCFKETNSKFLKEYLKNKGYTVILKHFPRYENPGGIFAKKYLQGRYNIEKSDSKNETDKYNKLHLVGSFYMMDMYDWYTTFCNTYGFKNKKTILIFDRWFYSTMYYLTKDINLSEKFKERIGYADIIFKDAESIFNLPKADILIKMNNNDINQIEIISKKRKAPQDIYEKDKFFLNEVRKNYNELNFSNYISDKFENKVLTINVSGKSKEEIQKEIFNSKEIEQIDEYKFPD